MSGGHFDYIQYRFSEIVEDMEEIINKQKEYDLDEEAVSHIQTGIKLLLTAGIYLQRIDWLVSGDDGLETFKKRLEEDLLNVPFHFENNPISLKIKKMTTGDVVRKKSGYQFIGYIIADFIKTTGERRLVVEEIRSGMLHIFNPEQVETFQYEKGTCSECGQVKIYHL